MKVYNYIEVVIEGGIWMVGKYHKIDGKIGQHNNKLYNRVISSGNKFFQTYENMWGAPIKYRVQDKH